MFVVSQGLQASNHIKKNLAYIPDSAYLFLGVSDSGHRSMLFNVAGWVYAGTW